MDKLISTYIAIIDFLSFSSKLRKIRQRLDYSLLRPGISENFPDSHPRGFSKRFRKRRITIVEAYLKIIYFLESDKYNKRLEALELLVEQVLSSRALEMPLNTARVQLALMKEVIKNKDNKRIQLERLQDFSICSYGQPRLIRKYLNELNIIEVPELNRPLKDLDMGWDSHVHDNSSSGRKNPTQLVIDAFIKGISRLTIVYNSLSHAEIMFEAIEAGRILGIDINIGLEFSVGPRGKRFYYIYQLPYFATKNSFKEFIHQHRRDLEIFIKGLSENQKNRTQSIYNLMDNFNRVYLSRINQGFPDEPIYNLEELSPGDMNLVIPIKHATHIHLGELLFKKLKPVLFNRVMYLKAQVKLSWGHFKAGAISRREFQDIEEKYLAVRKEFIELDAEHLRREYFSDPELLEYDSVFENLYDIFNAVKDETLLNRHIKIVHPLLHGLNEAVRRLLADRKYIAYVEIYNMHDVIDSDQRELLLLTRFIDYLNAGNTQGVLSFLDEHGIAIDSQLLEGLDESKALKLIPTCGSDSTGRTCYIPGMGFIYGKALAHKQYAGDYLKKHHVLPSFVSQMIIRKGEPGPGLPPEETSPDTGNVIINMGKSTRTHPNEIGDEHFLKPVPLKRVWRYLNPFIKNTFYILIGFMPAYLQLNWQFALLWFSITAMRHVLTDIISIRGLSPRKWHIRSIYFANIAHSLFWTGFSVPLLAFIKWQFDLLYPLVKSGIMFEFSKFFFICIVNGAYLSAHNTLRGFDKLTVRINFFRSLLAWPFAALFSPLGNLMDIPSIVQAKVWSDVVGGLIEGAAKFRLKLNIGKRDLQSLLPNICEHSEKMYTAILDLLYFFQVDPRTKNSLKAVLFDRHGITPPINQFKPDHAPAYYWELVNWFSDATHYFKLIDFILANYPPEQAIFLSDLVANKYTDFTRWLLKNKPKISKRSLKNLKKP